MLRTVFLALCAFILFTQSSFAQGVLSPAQFRDAALELVRAENPDVRVEIRDDLGVTFRHGSGKDASEFQMNLDRGYQEYLADPGALYEILGRWARLALGPPVDAQQLQRIVAVLRPMADVRAYDQAMQGAANPTSMVWRPFAGDIAEVLVFDSAEALQYASNYALSELGLTVEQAWAAAPVNLPERMGQLEIGGVEGADRLAFISGGNGLAPSVLIGAELCDEGTDAYYLIVDRNAFLSAESADAGAVRQLRELMNDLRSNGGLYSETVLACRGGAMAEANWTR